MAEHKVIDHQGNEVYSAEPIHPGEILFDELEAREIKQKDFASLIALRPSHLNELLHGKRNLTPVVALKLEKLLGISAGFWVRLQAEYDLENARMKVEKA